MKLDGGDLSRETWLVCYLDTRPLFSVEKEYCVCLVLRERRGLIGGFDLAFTYDT